MLDLWRLFYDLACVPVVRLTAPLVAPFNADVRSGLGARRGWRAALIRAVSESGRGRPRLWFHCASLGEFEQTRPILAELRRRHGDGPVVFLSFFSETGLRYGRHAGLADHAFLLPLDSPAAARRLLDLIRPDLVCFVKSDLWPELAWTAREAGVPVALVSAAVHRRSGVAHPLLRGFYRAVLGSCNYVSAADTLSARLLERVAPAGVEVTGDSKFDAVLTRRDSAAGPPIRFAKTGPVLVCGSTHPPDEEGLLPLLPELLAEREDLSVVLAPHHVDGGHLAGIESILATRGVTPERLTAVVERGGTAKGRLVLVDTVGCLFELYALARVAYVGGGFWDRGLHNVLEPAAFGAALVYGPRIGNSAEAVELAGMGAAERVGDFRQLEIALRRLLNDPAEARSRGAAARRYCERRAGASARIVDRLENLFLGPSPGRSWE
jgi:3-deoxy-D-manno-octulosonic-acid transferase